MSGFAGFAGGASLAALLQDLLGGQPLGEG